MLEQLDIFGGATKTAAPKTVRPAPAEQGALFTVTPAIARPDLHTDVLPIDAPAETGSTLKPTRPIVLVAPARRAGDDREPVLAEVWEDVEGATTVKVVFVHSRTSARVARTRILPPPLTPAEQAAKDAERAAWHAEFEASQAREAAELAESERLTTELLAAAGDVTPVRQTWAEAGRPERAVWFGRDITPTRHRALIVTFNDRGNRLYDARTGRQVAHYASDCPQWYAPVPVAAKTTQDAPAPADVVIVPCGGAKLTEPAPAGDLYVGSYHRATRRAAAAIAADTGARVLILSALHGLLELDRVVAPYDLRMGQADSVTPARVAEQAVALGVDGAVTVLAGRAYADVVTAVWPDARRPLDGTRGMGDQLARLAAIAAGRRSRAAA